MMSTPTQPPAEVRRDRDEPPAWLVPAAVAGIVGVALYVGGWLVSGLLRDGFDPLRQAISETFELGAPTVPRTVALVGLYASSVALAAFGPVLHRGLPGQGLTGPVLATVSGVMTALAGIFPCSSGCPGAGTAITDTLHVLAAGAGYVALILAPLFTGARVRQHLPRFARASFVLGGLALIGFLVRNLGPDVYGGLQQRIFNTVADGWYVLGAIVVIHRARSADRGDAGHLYERPGATGSGPA